jgi:hypothetical protein
LHGEPAEDGSEDPQAGGDERHDAEPGGCFTKEIVREGARPTTCGSCLRGGRVTRRAYEFLTLHHSAGPVYGNRGHEPEPAPFACDLAGSVWPRVSSRLCCSTPGIAECSLEFATGAPHDVYLRIGSCRVLC